MHFVPNLEEKFFEFYFSVSKKPRFYYVKSIKKEKKRKEKRGKKKKKGKKTTHKLFVLIRKKYFLSSLKIHEKILQGKMLRGYTYDTRSKRRL